MMQCITRFPCFCRFVSGQKIQVCRLMGGVQEPHQPIGYVSINIHLHLFHYSDVIMGAMASQITNLAIVYSTVYSNADQRKQLSSGLIGHFAGNSPLTGEFPAQIASNAENVSIWWRHHASACWILTSTDKRIVLDTASFFPVVSL